VQSEDWPDCRCLGKARGKFSPITDAEKTETTRGLDTTAVLLLSALGVLAALVGAMLIYLFHPVGIGVWLFVWFAFLAVHGGPIKTCVVERTVIVKTPIALVS
jgi:hypothetical protein